MRHLVKETGLRWYFVAAFTLFMLATSTADAAKRATQNKRHAVAKGETLSIIAKRYYGQPWQYVYLTSANRLSDYSSVKPGDIVKIPDVVDYRVVRGDTLASVAKRFFGTTELYSYLTWANRLRASAPLKVGQKLKIPFVLRHTVRKNDTLASVAQKYYRRSSMAKQVASWNGLKNDRQLRKRKYIWMAIRKGIKPAKKTPQRQPTIITKKKRVKILKVPKGHDYASMLLVGELMREGQYRRAADVLSKISRQELRTAEHKRDYYWRKMECHIALGERNLASAAFKKFQVANRKLSKQDSLNIEEMLSDMSPKIRLFIEGELRESKQAPSKKS